MIQGTSVPWTIRSRERMFQGTNGPGERKFHHGRERVVLRMNVPNTILVLVIVNL